MTNADLSDPTPRSVAVCGSCITRDNFNSRFNPDHRRWYSVDAQSNQSSMIALMSLPVEPDVREDDGLTEYDAWNVGSDLSRAFLNEIVETQPDHLILDFFGDLHFGVLELPDGRFVTDNRWKLHKTAQHAGWVEAGGTRVLRALDDPEAYFALWVEAMDRFAVYVADHCPRTQVVVHHGFYADKVVTGSTGRPRSLRKHANLPALKVGRINEFWARLDAHAVAAYGWESIDLSQERYTSVADHPWGPFWVHYSLDYYHRFLAELHQLDLARRSGPDVVDRVATIATAGRERIVNQDRFLRSTIAAERAQIEALESRGPLQSLRTSRRTAPR